MSPGPGGDGHPVRLSDEETIELLQRALAGDQEAWRELFASHEAWMRGVLKNRIPPALRPRFDTDDVIQSVFLELAQRSGSLRVPDAPGFRRWLARILLNELRERIEHAQAQRRHPGAEEPATGDGLAERAAADEYLARADLRARVLEAIDTLSPQDQELVTARYLEEREWAEVARITGLAETTCRNRAADIFERLMRRFL